MDAFKRALQKGGVKGLPGLKPKNKMKGGAHSPDETEGQVVTVSVRTPGKPAIPAKPSRPKGP